MKNNNYFILLYFFGSFTLLAQNSEKKQIETVFNQLVSAYGNAKSAPLLVVSSDKFSQNTPAFYTTTPKPTIKVDLQFYKLCQTFGKDSLNALSIVLSHELGHYYNDHTFCSDFAYAISKTNKIYSSKLKSVTKNEKVSLETQADYKGLFYSAIAGYSPFDVHAKLLDAIYKAYYIKDESERYPTKTERKAIAQNALKKTNGLYLLFKKGMNANASKKYQEAITAFEEVNSYFPSRENYNNIGVIKTLQALDLKVLTSEEYNYPKRFLYPLEIDNTSRLQQSSTRGPNDNQQEQMTALLKSAQKDFEKAISLDAKYTKGYINLACVFDLLDNPEAAIGKIKELPLEQQKQLDALRILAIAYYHADNEEKAKEIWGNIEK